MLVSSVKKEGKVRERKYNLEKEFEEARKLKIDLNNPRYTPFERDLYRGTIRVGEPDPNVLNPNMKTHVDDLNSYGRMIYGRVNRGDFRIARDGSLLIKGNDGRIVRVLSTDDQGLPIRGEQSTSE